MRLKSQILDTSSKLDRMIEETIDAVFEKSLPTILLIGNESDIFNNILSTFTWSKHNATVLFDDVDYHLIIVNNFNCYLQVLEVLPKSTALMFIDSSETLTIEQQQLCQQQLFAYLPNISARYAKGHVRCLLQVQKSLLGIYDRCPVMLSDNHHIRQLKSLFSRLDLNGSSNVYTDNISKFIACFHILSENTTYQNNKFFLSLDSFIERSSERTITTALVLLDDCNKINKALQHAPSDLRVVWIIPSADNADVTISLKESRDDFIMQTLYYCLEYNRGRKTTRFIQIGDIDKLLNKDIKSNENFRSLIMNTLTERKIRFRNTPIFTVGVSIGYVDLLDIIPHIEDKLLSRLSALSGDNFELAQVLSGMARTTLQQKFVHYNSPEQ